MMEQAHTLVVFSLPSTCQKQTTLRSHNDQCGFHLMFFCLLACFFVFCSSDRPVQACQSIVDMYTEKVPENIHTGITVHPWLFWNRLCRRTGFKGTVNVWLKDLSESGTNSGQSNCSWTTVHQTNQVSLERPRLKTAPTCGGSGLHAMRGSVPSPPSAQFETARGARTCEATTGRKLSLS